MNGLLKRVLMLGFCLTLLPFAPICAEEDADSAPTYTETGLQSSGKNTAGIVVGAVTVDGQNYQQVGIRADIPLGKLGIGLDIQLLIDEEGSVRDEDWDDAEDYFNILYYLRWDRKGAPFYAKIGSLDYSYIGYSNIVNGYSNAIEYPDYKRIGMEMSFQTEKFMGELLINDYKELAEDEPSVVIGTRLGYRILPKLVLGASVAADLNEYNGLRDTDDDGYPDEMDEFPYDGSLVTETERLLAAGVAQTTIDDLVAHGQLDGLTRANLPNYKDERSDLTIWGLDLGIPVIEGDFIKMDIYSAFTDIVDYGWGVTAPGFRTMFGEFVTLTAEYRFQSEEFLYGYFNHTYELERAQVVNDGVNKRAVTKQESLESITEDMDGYLAGLSVNLFNYVAASAQFQNMKGGDIEKKSLLGEVILNNKAIDILPTVKGYYAQNNVDSLKEWRTPSTVAGIIVQLNMGGTTLSFNHQYTFVDKNGDGVIDGDDETVKTLSVSSTVTF
ncbi:hypothetical protein JCM14469_09520 [Desulfatiferula olefinivorans]